VLLCSFDKQDFCIRCGRLRPFAGLDAMCGRDKPHGIGSHLKIILRRLGIKNGSGCNCSENARNLNRWNADMAEARIEEIVAMLRDAAKTRNMVFSNSIARLIVRRAISNYRAEASRMNARKEAQRAEETT